MGATPHKGSWGDRYIIEQRPNQKRITCSFCRYYNGDGSCKAKPIVIAEVGYNYWKHCNAFYLGDEYNTPENRTSVARGKKVVSTYVEEVAATVEQNIKEELPWRKTIKKAPKRIRLGTEVWVHDITYDEEVLYKLVGPAKADPIEGKISIASPVGKGLLGAKEGDIFNVETPSGTMKYKVLIIK